MGSARYHWLEAQDKAATRSKDREEGRALTLLRLREDRGRDYQMHASPPAKWEDQWE